MRRCDIRFSAGVGPASVLDLLTNGSFEVATGIGANAALAPGATNLVGWTVIGGGNLLWCDSSSYCDRSASQGTYSLDLTGLTNVSPYAGVEQAIATTPGVTYELTFDVAGRSDSMPVGVRATAGTTSALFSSGRDWSVQKLTFVAGAATTTISIVGDSASGSGLDIQVDNAAVALGPVPEPPGVALFLVGGIGLVAVRRFARSGSLS